MGANADSLGFCGLTCAPTGNSYLKTDSILIVRTVYFTKQEEMCTSRILVQAVNQKDRRQQDKKDSGTGRGKGYHLFGYAGWV
jgi:hypothetical protein